MTCKHCNGYGYVVHSQTTQEKAYAHERALERENWMDTMFICMAQSCYTKLACPVCGGFDAPIPD
jgi:rhamnogalacturonyl hydrolase YesR